MAAKKCSAGHVDPSPNPSTKRE
jgi:hypothetical protein